MCVCVCAAAHIMQPYLIIIWSSFLIFLSNVLCHGWKSAAQESEVGRVGVSRGQGSIAESACCSPLEAGSRMRSHGPESSPSCGSVSGNTKARRASVP